MHTCVEKLFVLTIFSILLLIGVPAFNGVQTKAKQMQACNKCRALIIAMKGHADEHAGAYPDGKTANEVFRVLIRGGYFDDESFFTAPESPYHGDDKIGVAPDFSEALKPGENHWALTRGLNDKSEAKWPLVFENPKEASWPPRWDAGAIGEIKPGRVWRNRRICVGYNDGSIIAERIADTGLELETVEAGKDGRNIFELAGPHEILDVEK